MSLGRLGKYELLERLSRGGMGELFVARTEGPGGFERIVALKRIRTGAGHDEAFIQMFVEEAKVASLLSHQNLVHLYDFGSEDETLYLAMELVEGHDLSRVLARCRELRSPFPIELAVEIAIEVAAGLDHLHRLHHRGKSLQLVHRDVSPQNIMLSFDGAIKLTDFGIVSVKRHERLTRLGVVKGKVGYLSPEQVTDSPVDARSDVFSLGIVLWECLTGARLFSATSDLEALQQVMSKPLRPPSSLNPEVPTALDSIVMQALERAPPSRFQDAAEFGRALRSLPQARVEPRGLVQLMRRLYPEGAQDRLLKLLSSVELTALPEAVQLPAGSNRMPPPLPIASSPAAPPIELPLRPTLRDQEVAHATEMLTAVTVAGPPTQPTRILAPVKPRTRLPWVLLGLGFLLAALAIVRMRAPRARPLVPAPTQAEVAPSSTVVAAPAPPGPITVSASESQLPVAPIEPAPPINSSTLPTIVAAAARREAALTVTPQIAPDAGGAVEKAPRQKRIVRTAHGKSNAGKVRQDALGSPGAPAPAAHAEVGTATLAAVKLHPWAEVVVDGHSQEWFSPGRWSVTAGRHEIILQNPEAGIERHFSMQIGPGQTVLFRGELKTVQPRSDE